MTDEFDELLEETPPEPLPASEAELLAKRVVVYDAALGEAETSPLVRASQLLSPEDEDQGDFEPGGLYKGFRILPEHLWPADEWTPQHQLRYGGRFYVESPSGTPGLVPFPGSQIIWPWERGWSLDLHRVEVESLLKPDEEKKGRKR